MKVKDFIEKNIDKLNEKFENKLWEQIEIQIKDDNITDEQILENVHKALNSNVDINQIKGS